MSRSATGPTEYERALAERVQHLENVAREEHARVLELETRVTELEAQIAKLEDEEGDSYQRGVQAGQESMWTP